MMTRSLRILKGRCVVESNIQMMMQDSLCGHLKCHLMSLTVTRVNMPQEFGDFPALPNSRQLNTVWLNRFLVMFLQHKKIKLLILFSVLFSAMDCRIHLRKDQKCCSPSPPPQPRLFQLGDVTGGPHSQAMMGQRVGGGAFLQVSCSRRTGSNRANVKTSRRKFEWSGRGSESSRSKMGRSVLCRSYR